MMRHDLPGKRDDDHRTARHAGKTCRAVYKAAGDAQAGPAPEALTEGRSLNGGREIKPLSLARALARCNPFKRIRPDRTVGPRNRPQMRRWYLFESRRERRERQGLPIRRLDELLGVNVCVHEWLESDPPGLHSHAWDNWSIVLGGTALERTPSGVRRLSRGMIIRRRAADLHRVDIEPGRRLWTLFITGRERRVAGYLVD
jgi:hypothetical protein